MSETDRILLLITSSSILLPLLVWLGTYRLQVGVARPIIYYILLQVAGELLGYFTNGANNQLYLLFYSVPEVAALSWFFYQAGVMRKHIPWLAAVAVASYIVEALWMGNWSNTYAVSRGISYAYIVLLSICQIHILFSNMQTYAVYKNSMFLIASSMLLYFGVSLLFVLLKPVYLSLSNELLIEVFRIKLLLSIIARMLMSVGLWMNRFKPY